MTHFRRLSLLLLVLLAAPVRAQLDGATVLSADQIAARIKPMRPKTVILVFDVTQSTLHGGMFGTERAGAATILRDGCSSGDRVALLKFGTGFQRVFDATLKQEADKSPLVDQLPPGVEPGHGTDIRWPHHEALRMVQGDLPRDGVIVLLTDSFNDRPDPTDPNNAKYLAYYSPKGLTVYPDTADNRDYERLLRTLGGGGHLHQYGVGIALAPDGRPIERLPAGPGQGDTPDSGGGTIAASASSQIGHETRQSSLPLILGGVFLLLLALLAALFAAMNRAQPLRLRLGDKSLPRDFRLKPGQRVLIGGTPLTAGPGDETFPVAGVTAPLAAVLAGRGSLTLQPLTDARTVFHNGAALEQPAPVRVGDELRIALPASDTAPAREHRIRVDDPRGSAL